MNKWDFKSELSRLCASCAGVKESTARAKANKFFRLHENYFPYWGSQVEDLEKQNDKLNLILKAIKENKIYFDGGYLVYSEIESISSNDESILITMKSGKLINLEKKSFKWLVN